MPLKISNRDMRRVWLHLHGLSATPTGPATPDGIYDIIKSLGFVQLDTIRVVARAHQHILWSRNQNYREHMLWDLLERDRRLFEHFTHDASILPVEFYPYWQRQFRRMGARLEKGTWAKVLPPHKERLKIRRRIEEEGPLCTKDFTGKADKTKHAWARPPHKYALDYLWYKGDLATSHRRKFIKYYDLAERVIPDQYASLAHEDNHQLDWLCNEALARLGAASESEIQRFWDTADLPEVKGWVRGQGAALVPVEIQSADKSWVAAFAPENIETLLEEANAPTSRLRIINPFDPAIRDRDRLLRLFGFDYRIEIFTPAAKRVYGYYVYPILEGDRFIGRIEVVADRKAGEMRVEKVWWESKIACTTARQNKLEAEIVRLAKFVGVETITWNTKP